MKLPEISWLGWHYLIYAVLIMILFFIMMRIYQQRHNRAINSLSSTQWRSLVLINYSRKKQIKKYCLYLCGIALLCIALLRPAWGTIEEKIEQEGRDLFIALDISRSMLAQDYQPNRLEFAKTKIKSLLNYLRCERIGLILFSGSTIVQCPLTTDYAAFFMFLDQLDAETISSGTTALDQAIKKALEVFSAMPNKKSKLLVIFTDGEDFSSNLADIKKQALDIGMNIFTLGVGTPEGAPIPVVDERGRAHGHQRDAKGSIVISHLNEGILTTLARDSGGIYLRAQQDDSDLKTLVRHLESFEKEKFDDKKVSTEQERYYFFVALALLCFILEWFL